MDQENLNELMQVRRRKMDQLRERGVEPYGKKIKASHYSTEIIEQFAELENSVVTVTGRIVSIRAHGKAPLLTCRITGRIQVYFRLDQLGEDKYASLTMRPGRLYRGPGHRLPDQKGEVTVAAEDWYFWQNLRPLRKNGTG